MHRRQLLTGLALLGAWPLARGQEGGRAGAGSAPVPPSIEEELQAYPHCILCHMDRRKFHHARHLLVFGDDQMAGTCSVHCAAESMLQERHRGFKHVFAPDYGTAGNPKPLIEAGSASYLIGSDLPGVMTPVSKVAFARREDALLAQRTYGGRLEDFSGAVRASLDEMASSLLRRYNDGQERQRRKTG